MTAIFLKMVNMSIVAGWLVLAVILLRFALKKAPKWIRCLLWGIVALRLIMPFSFESIFSLIPSTETIDTTTYQARPYIQTGVSIVDNNINEYLGSHYFEGVTVPSNHFSHILTILSIIWLTGMIAMLFYSFISYYRLYRKVQASLRHGDNIYFCDYIDSPFILGILRPGIYLPSGLSKEQVNYVITHENAHLKRKDHLWKPLGFALLGIYWFQPILWAAYMLFCRDIEQACDEKVIKDMSSDAKRGYSEALVACSVQRRMIMVCPLAFGELNIKDRVKSVLNYKKPAFRLVAIAITACIIMAVCFLTDPASDSDADILQEPYITFYYPDSVDPMTPTIMLSTETKNFQFIYSVLSSYIAIGTYELDNDTLTLRTGDGKYTYIFTYNNPFLIFDGLKSSKIPEYRYSGSSYETYCPVPHGAVFVPGARAEGIIGYTSPVITRLTFDIDDDSKEEQCFLTYGLSSGIFSVEFSVWDNGQMEYHDLFWVPHCELSFKKDNTGAVYLEGVTQSDPQMSYRFDITIEDGHIVLSENGKPLNYWNGPGYLSE